MECAICISPKKPKEILNCPCGASACVSCQQQYGRPSCMSCSTEFTKGYLIKEGHDKLVKALLRPFQEKVYWDREATLLPQTQKLVDHEAIVTELKKHARFGYRVTIPPKPSVEMISASGQVFPCPGEECRGFVSQGAVLKCGSCKQLVCNKCREFVRQDHECNQATIQSIAMIQADSRPCPKCSAAIFRTAGCDHMFCTHCRTHFHWESGRILQSSTNHHYDNTRAFASNLALRVNGGLECGSDPTLHSVSQNLVNHRVGTEVYRMLYEETNMARELMNSMFDAQKNTFQHSEALIRVRMAYLRKEMDEAKARAKVWVLEEAYKKKQDLQQLLLVFLTIVNDLQRLWQSKKFPAEDEEIMGLYKNLMEICNSSSQSIQAEYGGAVLQFGFDLSTRRPFVTLKEV